MQTNFPDSPSSAPKGLGGWLMLFILGLTYSVLRANYLLYSVHLPIFRDGTWEALTTAGSENYHVYWAPLLILETAGNVLVIGLSVLALVLLLQRKRHAPRFAIVAVAASSSFVLIDYVAAGQIPAVVEQGSSDAIRELVRAALGAIIWIPYFLVSKRVKATFVE